jgi:GTP:adenosylcobinamide-phosphate guanylyltransferase
LADQRTNAVVLAGGKASQEITAMTGVANRALLPLGDRTMLDYVVDALAGSASIENICVVGDVPTNGRYAVVMDQGSLFDNLLAGLVAAGGAHVLVATADIPFITPAAIDDFVAAAHRRNADIAYPIVSMESCRKRFDGMKRTSVRLKEGVFTGGNIMLLRTEFVASRRDRIRQAYAARKDILRLGALLGPVLLLRLLLSQTIAPSALTLPIAEAAVANVLGDGARVAAIITDYPEIGTDVDKPEDIEIARRLLAGR